MGTWTRFYINTSDIDRVAHTLKEVSLIKESTTGNVPDDFYGNFLLNETAYPRLFGFWSSSKKLDNSSL